MKVEINKFGGGIVNSSDSIEHVAKILETKVNFPTVLVFSALGKTTNHLEALAEAYQLGQESDEIEEMIESISSFHLDIAEKLFPKGHEIFSEIEGLFEDIRAIALFKNNFQFHLFKDQIISFGEILAVKIISRYLSLIGIRNHPVDAFDLIKTNFFFGRATVKEKTFSNIREEIPKIFFKGIEVIPTHGFLGSYDPGLNNSNAFVPKFMTTLGREGSDYTAGIFGNALNAEKVTLWKNVPGIMDKDPNVPGGEGAELIPKLSYERCEELLSGTAKGIIHENTIGVLKDKKIPLHIKSFWNPDGPGTLIS